MAVTFQGAGASVGGGVAVTTLSPAFPTGWAADDIAFLWVRVVETNSVVTLPAGWTSVIDATSGTATHLILAWRRLVAGDTPGSVTRTGASGAWGARIFAYRGARTSGDPWDVAPAATLSALSTTVTAPSIVVPNSTDLVVMLASRANATAAQTSGWAATDPSTLTEQLDDAGANGNGLAIADGTQTVTGATGAGTATLAVSARNEGVMMALAAAGGTVKTGSASLSGQSALTAAGGLVLSSPASLSGQSTFVSDGSKVSSGAAAFTGQSLLFANTSDAPYVHHRSPLRGNYGSQSKVIGGYTAGGIVKPQEQHDDVKGGFRSDGTLV